jgi:hypothetical protein
MKFLEACQAAYQKAVNDMIKSKRECAVDLYLGGESQDIQVWNNGYIQFYSSWLHLQDLQSDGWEIEDD